MSIGDYPDGCWLCGSPLGEVCPATCRIWRHKRIAVVGVPRSGKTTFAVELAQVLGLDLWHTDDLRRPDGDWRKQAAEAVGWMARAGPWLVEGVTALFALEASAGADIVVWFPEPRVPLTRGQESLARRCLESWCRLTISLSEAGSWVLGSPEEAWTWLGELGE